MQMSRAGYGHDLMTDNDMEVHWILMKLILNIDNDDCYLKPSNYTQYTSGIAGTVSGD